MWGKVDQYKGITKQETSFICMKQMQICLYTSFKKYGSMKDELFN